MAGFYSYVVLEDTVSTLDFEPCFKVHNVVSVYPKRIKLGQMTSLNVIFHVVVSVYRLAKI